MNGRRATSTGRARHRGLLLIWGAQLMSLALFLLLTQFGEVSLREGDDNSVLLLVLGLTGLAAFGLSFPLRAKLLAQSAVQQRPDLATTAYVIAFAMCESCALFGLVAHFATGARESLYFFIPAAVGLLLHFPRREHFADPPRAGAGFSEEA
jgi:F0F1-type ATP synthase membrane subunit c/vacuolar-type H+-ATPase subunit K